MKEKQSVIKIIQKNDIKYTYKRMQTFYKIYGEKTTEQYTYNML